MSGQSPEHDYKLPLQSSDIMKLLPHRWPMLHVDRIIELEPGQRAVGIKNVSADGAWAQGHWPERPVFPGVLLIEACNQVGAVLALSAAENKGKGMAVGALGETRFRDPKDQFGILPGDQIIIEVVKTRNKGPVFRGLATAKVGDSIVLEIEITGALFDLDV